MIMGKCNYILNKHGLFHRISLFTVSRCNNDVTPATELMFK